MQSISLPTMHVVPVDLKNDDGDYDILQLDKLLNKVFGDELDRALAAGGEVIDLSVGAHSEQRTNLIEFPLIQELFELEQEHIATAGTLDFSPVAFDLDDPVLETDLTRFTPSIIEADDSVDNSHLQAIVDAQQEQLATLRAELKQKDIIIRSQAVDLANKDDQLKYLPDFFDKAIRLASVEAQNTMLNKDLEVERLVNEELHLELTRSQTELAAVNNHLLVKFARTLGLLS